MTHRIIALFVTLAFGLCVAPLGADAQPFGKVARIGYLSVAGSPGSLFMEAFRQGLRELGYVEGQNIAIDFREAEGSAQFPALAAELVQRPVDVVVAWSVGAAQAVKHLTTTMPIVMLSLGDPVATGLVASLARPGGNITGLTGMATELGGKRLELLREAVPSLSRVAVLWNARDPTMTQTFREIQAAAPALGVAVQPLGVHELNDIDRAVAALTEERPDALFMITDMLTRSRTQQVVDFAAQRHLPTLFEGRGPVAEGALMSYGPSFPDLFRRAATYEVFCRINGSNPYRRFTDTPRPSARGVTLTVGLSAAW